MFTAKIFFAAAAGFLAGIYASPFFSEQPTSTQQVFPVEKPITFAPPKIQSDNTLLAVMESVEAMLIEQNVRLQSTEERINDLLDASTAVESSGYIKDVALDEIVEVEEDPSHYQYVSKYVDSQLREGTWSTDNAYHMIEETAKLSLASRTEIQLKIVQAINAGRLEINDPSIPIF